MEYTFEIRFRRGTSSQWSAVNPVLSPGEPGYVTDLNTLKVGDGLTAWNDLPWATGGGGEGGTTNHALLINRNSADQHTISAITGLQNELDSKAASSHNHDGAYDPSGSADAAVTTANAYTDAGLSGKADISHTHTESDISDLGPYISQADHALIDHTGLPGVGSGGGSSVSFDPTQPDAATYGFWAVT